MRGGTCKLMRNNITKFDKIHESTKLMSNYNIIDTNFKNHRLRIVISQYLAGTNLAQSTNTVQLLDHFSSEIQRKAIMLRQLSARN